jgi:hypothetical protein
MEALAPLLPLAVNDLLALLLRRASTDLSQQNEWKWADEVLHKAFDLKNDQCQDEHLDQQRDPHGWKLSV